MFLNLNNKNQKGRRVFKLQGYWVVVFLCTSLCSFIVQANTENPLRTAVGEQVVNQASCSGQSGPPVALRMPAGKSKFLRMQNSISRLTVGNGEIVHAKLISPRELYLFGSSIGTTNMILKQGKGCKVFDVTVHLDAAPLMEMFNMAMPYETSIRVETAGDSIVLLGEVSDAITAQHIESIALSYVLRTAKNLDVIGGEKGTALSASTKAKDLVINMLRVKQPQQVSVAVKVAEVTKSYLDTLGTALVGSTVRGDTTIDVLSNLLSGTPGTSFGVLRRGYQFWLEAGINDGLVRILAEPNVMAISGQEGSFLAGGKILIPVEQDSDAGRSSITLEEKEFGVSLKFLPTVLANDRINLNVSPEVSELSRDGVGITTGGIFGGTSVLPLITTRRASTTVQLYDGQSFAIGGLIKSSSTSNIKMFPFLGEIPILGSVFRSTSFQNEESELVFIVTPKLVKPLEGEVQLPTDKVGPTDRRRLMLEGRLDSEPLIDRKHQAQNGMSARYYGQESQQREKTVIDEPKSQVQELMPLGEHELHDDATHTMIHPSFGDLSYEEQHTPVEEQVIELYQTTTELEVAPDSSSTGEAESEPFEKPATEEPSIEERSSTEDQSSIQKERGEQEPQNVQRHEDASHIMSIHPPFEGSSDKEQYPSMEEQIMEIYQTAADLGVAPDSSLTEDAENKDAEKPTIEEPSTKQPANTKRKSGAQKQQGEPLYKGVETAQAVIPLVFQGLSGEEKIVEVYQATADLNVVSSSDSVVGAVNKHLEKLDKEEQSNTEKQLSTQEKTNTQKPPLNIEKQELVGEQPGWKNELFVRQQSIETIGGDRQHFGLDVSNIYSWDEFFAWSTKRRSGDRFDAVHILFDGF